ncbi:MAG: bifunctional folylpolyglutamate synthase/dihydrofolate synthase [Gammaproteobacteria bacterium]
MSYFEFGTLAALDIFSRYKVDIQLLEVGMGGRLDAVNIVDPDVALISSIGIDHVDWLGKTRENIGLEKAGIFRTQTPAIVGDPDPPLSLIKKAEDGNAQLYCIGRDFRYEKSETGWQWVSPAREISLLPEPGLQGEHQYRNAASVVLAVSVLQDRLPVSDASIRTGLSNTQLKGRFQLIDGKIPVLLDVGHNPEAVRTLVQYLGEHFPEKRIHAIFSMMKDKDIAGVLDIMKPIVCDWFFTPLASPRTVTETTIRELFFRNSIGNASFGHKNFAEAFAAAKNQSREGDMILVFGSFLLVSDCLIELEKR